MYEKPRKALKLARDIRGLTQESLAELTNYSVDSIRQWESGARPASVPVLMELADKLEAPWLIALYLREQYGDGCLRGLIPDFEVGMPVAVAVAGYITHLLDQVDKRFDRELLKMVADGRIDEIEEPMFERVSAEAWVLMMDILNMHFHG